jgi:hypothetical protein
MATRKFAIMGNGTNSTIKVTVGGVETYNGPVTDTSEGIGQLAIVSFDNDNSVNSVKSISIEVLSGDIEIGDLQYNLVNVLNPALTPTEAAFATVPAAEIPAEIAASVAAKGGFIVNGQDYFGAVSFNVEYDSRSNVFINGIAQTPENNPDTTHLYVPIAGWMWDVASGSTISFDATVPAQQSIQS